MTKQQRTILNIIQQSDSHLTAEQIYLCAKAQIPSIAVGTVYRNLTALSNTGIIRKILVANAPDRFDKTIGKHDHVICEKCGKMLDIPIGDLTQDIENRLGRPIISYELNVKYICPMCSKKI